MHGIWSSIRCRKVRCHAILAIAGCRAHLIGVWYLYKWEGRSLGAGASEIAIGSPCRLMAARRLSSGCMLCDLVLVIDRRERMPSNLLVLVDTSESMKALTDPYDDATARASS